MINKSLTVLGNVISSLVEAARGSSLHIPYRDSKLTYLLKDSLGGNSKTYMIAAISIANTQFQETLSTLKFAQRVKLIQNKAQANEIVSGNQVKRLQQEIEHLKEQLRNSLAVVAGPEQPNNELKALVEEVRKQIPCYAKQEAMQTEINWKELQNSLTNLENHESGGKVGELMDQIEELNQTVEILQKR